VASVFELELVRVRARAGAAGVARAGAAGVDVDLVEVGGGDAVCCLMPQLHHTADRIQVLETASTCWGPLYSAFLALLGTVQLASSIVDSCERVSSSTKPFASCGRLQWSQLLATEISVSKSTRRTSVCGMGGAWGRTRVVSVDVSGYVRARSMTECTDSVSLDEGVGKQDCR
jgi:hypothetical protein